VNVERGEFGRGNQAGIEEDVRVIRKDSLSCLEKRDLLNQPAASIETLSSWGGKYEEAGSVFDALDFYAKANNREALERLLKLASDEGDVFLFKQVCRVLKYEPGAEEWLAVAKKAEELGKLAFAAQAYRLGGHEETAEQNGSSA
jgi:hypothetical protein